MGQSSGNIYAPAPEGGPMNIGDPVRVVNGPEGPPKLSQFGQQAGKNVLSGIAGALSGQQGPISGQGYQPPIYYGQQAQAPMFSAYNYPGGGGFYGGM